MPAAASMARRPLAISFSLITRNSNTTLRLRCRRDSAGISASTPTGTELELAVTQERDISNRSPEQQTARAGLTITQSLLRGLRPSVNLAAVRQAELETDASLYELRGFVEALVEPINESVSQ